jgi:hypothetical protein
MSRIYRPRYGTMSSMKRLNQHGSVDSWLIAFIVTLIVFFATAGFGLWAFMGKQDYKNNVDAKIDNAVEAAVEKNSANKEKDFIEREKEPLRTYRGPAAYGSVSLTYPKTWNLYMDETAKSLNAIDGTLNPNFVPGLQSGSSVALRILVINNQYASIVKSLESNIKSGKIKASPYKADKVPQAVGLRVDGEVVLGKQGSMVILPLRDKTLQVWTEAVQFVPDFNSIILPNLNFVP